MAKKPRIQIGPRDEALLASLEYSPFTATQLLKLSQTFSSPFTDEHTLRRRMRQLNTAGLVRAFPYAVASLGRSPSYFKLTQAGFRHVHGSETVLPHRRYFEAVSDAHHHHTFALAEFLVRLFRAADDCGAIVEEFFRENSVSIEANGHRLRPDCAFQISVPGRSPLRFVVELDNGSERVRSQLDVESIERKIRGYDAHQQGLSAFDPARHVVLFVTTRSEVRLRAILDAIRQLTSNPQRRIFLGTTLEEFLAAKSPLSERCFVDAKSRRVAMIPQQKRNGNAVNKPVQFQPQVALIC